LNIHLIILETFGPYGPGLIRPLLAKQLLDGFVGAIAGVAMARGSH
jgi:hypothetical protein